MNELPGRPDLQYRPEVVQIAAPRRKVWPWVLGTAIVLVLFLGVLMFRPQGLMGKA